MKQLLIILLTAASMAATAAQPPNIVLILSDDQAWTDYSFMGHEQIKTPRIDKLASEGVLFRRAYVPTALCRPSLAILATGHYAHKNGVTGNDPSPANDRHGPAGSPQYNEARAKIISYIDQFDTLPELLVKQGYLTHQSGKWWEGDPKNCGFTHAMTRGYPKPGGRHGDDGLKIGRTGNKPVEDFIDHSLEQKKPFFLWYAPFMPHTPHTPPKRLQEKYLAHGLPKPVANYYAMCEWFDEACGQLIDFVDKRGQTNNTLFVYVCDNGWIQDPKRPNRYDKRSKQTPYEAGIRTPIFYTWPGTLQPQDRPELSSSLDIYPTILAAAGITPPADRPGLNLMPEMKEKKRISRDIIYGETFAHDIADITNPEESLLFRWCIKDKWKLLLTYDGEVNRYKSTHPRTEKRPQLFDLKADPSEKKNLASSHPEIVAELAKKIQDWYPLKTRKAQTGWQ